MKQGTLRDLAYKNKFKTDKKRTNSINNLVEKEEEREGKREETELSSREYKNIKDYGTSNCKAFSTYKVP